MPPRSDVAALFAITPSELVSDAQQCRDRRAIRHLPATASGPPN